ncbi:hypothetical protein pipiens_018066, partial [Culex pipiens pipiens]
MAHRWSLTGNSGGGVGQEEERLVVLPVKSVGMSLKSQFCWIDLTSRSSAAPRIIARGNQRRTVNDGGQRQHNDRTSGVDDGRDSDDEERIMILDEQQHQQQPSQSKRCKRNGNAK